MKLQNIVGKSSKLNDYIHFENTQNFYIKSVIFKMYVVIQFGRFHSENQNLDLINRGIKSY